MEQWEIDLRKELDEILVEGKFSIGESPNIVKVGKAGAINYMVENEKKKQSLAEFYENNKNIDKSSEKYKKNFAAFIDKLNKKEK